MEQNIKFYSKDQFKYLKRVIAVPKMGPTSLESNPLFSSFEPYQNPKPKKMRTRLEITTKFEEGKKCSILTSWVRRLKKPNTICHSESNTKYITCSIRKNNQNKGPESKLLETAIEKIIDFSQTKARGAESKMQ